MTYVVLRRVVHLRSRCVSVFHVLDVLFLFDSSQLFVALVGLIQTGVKLNSS